jgi:predicted Zn-dependent protease
MGFRLGMAAAGIVGLLGLGGCTVNPATGQQSFTGLMSPDQEAEVGREQHAQVVAEFGGVYDEARIGGFVAQVGSRLVQVSETPQIRFTFTVLDSPVVNAFALPGGYVYVTRGLLALASSEAEIAGVLGHEIGHVVARHTAQRYSRGVAASLGAAVLGAVLGSDLSEVATLGAGAYVQSFSREQEFEADMLGVRYLSRAGYDPRGMSSLLAKLQANSAYEAAAAGGSAKEGFDIMASHPRTSERVARATEEAAVPAGGAQRVGGPEYLSLVDGLIWGDDPEQGVVRGRRFAHPGLGIEFTVPEGFRLANGPKQVTARGPGGAILVFDVASRESSQSMSDYLKQWARNTPFERIEPVAVDGFDAATGFAKLETQQGVLDLRAVAIGGPGAEISRFLFATPPAASRQLAPALQATVQSFRALGTAEVAAVRPLRVSVVAVPAGGVRALAAAMPVEGDRQRLIEILNGLAPGQTLPPGTRVKTVR